MSLESQIADLVSATNALITTFNTKKASIDTAVAAAIAAVPVNKRRFYVNQLTGSDTNDGEAATPLKTVEKAIANTPVGGMCSVFLQADYTMTADISLEARVLEWRTETIGVKKKLTPTYVSVDGTTRMTGLVGGLGSMMVLRDVTITLPSATGILPAPGGFTNAFFRGTGGGGSPLVAMKMDGVEVVDTAGATCSLCGQGSCGLVLETTGSTFPSGFAGRYVSGVAAGTAANTLANVLTNISTL